MNDFINNITSAGLSRDVNLIRKAFFFAKERHAGQMRKFSDDPYFLHPVRVGLLLRDFDDEVIIAGLLHDVLEDTETTVRELEEQFGSNITLLVLGCTKDPERGTPVEILRRAAEQDSRVIYVKLADRADNLQDDPANLKVSTVENYVNQTPLILELASEHGITFLVGEIQDRIGKLKIGRKRCRTKSD